MPFVVQGDEASVSFQVALPTRLLVGPHRGHDQRGQGWHVGVSILTMCGIRNHPIQDGGLIGLEPNGHVDGGVNLGCSERWKSHLE
jgi:hypothetical protein